MSVGVRPANSRSARRSPSSVSQKTVPAGASRESGGTGSIMGEKRNVQHIAQIAVTTHADVVSAKRLTAAYASACAATSESNPVTNAAANKPAPTNMGGAEHCDAASAAPANAAAHPQNTAIKRMMMPMNCLTRLTRALVFGSGLWLWSLALVFGSGTLSLCPASDRRMVLMRVTQRGFACAESAGPLGKNGRPRGNVCRQMRRRVTPC